MAKCVKFILFLLLSIFLQGTLSNITTEKVVDEGYVHDLAISINNLGGIRDSDFPFSPVAELANNSQSTYQVTMARIQRVLTDEYFFCLKSLLLCWADRESSLLQHQAHIYNTTISYLGRSVSEYYVFAIRHIII